MEFINNFISKEFTHSLLINEEDITHIDLFEKFLSTLKGFKQSFYFNDNIYKIIFENINLKEFEKNSTVIDRFLRR